VTRPWMVKRSAGQPPPGRSPATSFVSIPCRKETRSSPVARTTVSYPGQHALGTIVINTPERRLYLITGIISLLLLAYLIVLELVAIPAFALLLLGPSLGEGLPGLVGVLALGDLGVAVIGTLVAALAVRTRARDLLGPLLGLPLFVPIVIGGARATSPLLTYGHHGAPAARWLLTLGLYDLVFGLIAYALFDFLLED